MLLMKGYAARPRCVLVNPLGVSPCNGNAHIGLLSCPVSLRYDSTVRIRTVLLSVQPERPEQFHLLPKLSIVEPI